MFYPTTDDLLASMGLARRQAVPTVPAWVAPATLMFGAGCLAGAAGALLLTPRTGPELRGELLLVAKEASETVRSKLPDLGGNGPPLDEASEIPGNADAA